MAEQLGHSGKNDRPPNSDNYPEVSDSKCEDGLRRSQRECWPTDKSLQYRAEQVKRVESTFNKVYAAFKSQLLTIRDNIKRPCLEDELANLQQCLEEAHDKVVNAYEGLKVHMPVIDNFANYQKRMDTASACKLDMMTHLYYRLSEVDVREFNTDDELEQLKALKKPYAASVYSTAAEATEVAADYAAKKVRVQALHLQERERVHLTQLEAEKREKCEAVEMQQRKLELLKAQQELEENDARLKVLNAAVMEDDAASCFSSPSNVSYHGIPGHQHGTALNARAPVFMPHVDPTSVNAVGAGPVEGSTLVGALSAAMDRNRLPVPTPRIFTGDPMEFVGFKRSFKTLIENKGISAEEKIYYLQQYVSGNAKDAIAGCFYGTNESDYKHAWDLLEKRFGHSFKIQEAFRDKLDKWPKIGPRDSVGLQKYADFLQTCLDAIPHVKDLRILNDCKENQRMAAKLPDWMITRWSRVVAKSLDADKYPSFREFVTFVATEARVACHPVTSLQAVKGSGLVTEPKSSSEMKRKPARSLATDNSGTFSKERTELSDQKGKKSCPFCKGEHYLPECPRFAEQSLEERNAFIQRDKRCFGCLRTGHFTKQCKVRHTCQKCKVCHPTVLHNDKKGKNPAQRIGSHSQNVEVERAASLNADNGHSNTTNVVPVWVSVASNPEVEILVYALLDTQSDSTFIEETICERLSAPTDPVKLKLSTLLGKDVTVACKRARELRVRGYTSTRYISLPPTYTREFIPLDREHIPTCETAKRWSHLVNVCSEIPPLLQCEVGLLIGYNCSAALAPRQTIIGDEDQPYAVKTDLGWSIVGSLAPVDSSDVSGICHRVSLKELPPVVPRDVLSVLETDFKDISHGDVSSSQEDIQFLRMIEKRIVMNTEGHLEMPLPFKTRPSMPNNRKLALKRLSQLKGRFDHNPKYMEQYSQFISEMLQEGHAEPATEKARPGEVYYIPHHGVYHPKKPDKLRVVFDCSATYQGQSLNDHLLSGPDLTNDLFGVLCRFRHHPVAVMCDIEQMFHQFHVTLEDRDYLRFLWWEGGDTSKEPLEYRMNVHLFGAKSSPVCANFGLKHLSQIFEHEYPLAGPFLRQDFYVDDGITSRPSAEEAVKLIKESRELCARGDLRLHKFVSNDRSVLENISVSERASEVQKVDLNKDELPVERALGLQWSVEHDNFVFQAQNRELSDTRRGILSTVACIYDPVGFISPFVLEGKAILQEMCRRGVSWDELISQDLRPRWERWKSDIQNLEAVQIPRCYKPADFASVTRTELHHFSDASTDGYGTCSYLRLFGENRVHCCLIASKARVSPVKVVTIPRLELTAAVVAVKMSQKLKAELKMQIDDEYFWCDSQIVLGYINNDARRFHVFVANRVQFIRDHTRTDQWQYVSTQENPADHASRGRSVAQLLASNWFTGPDFLWSTDMVKLSSIEPSLMLGDPEVRACSLHTQSEDSSDLLDRFSRYSDWIFVSRIVARILRLFHSDVESRFLTVEEIDRAGLCLIRLVQEAVFRNERKALIKGQAIPLTSKLRNLDLYVTNDIIRVGGRLRNSSLPLNQKHPVLLPRDGHVTQLIVAHCHKQIHHQGRGQTLNEIRSRGYWILGGSRVVADYIHNCVQCRKLRRPVQEQKMADLPPDRVEPTPPFSFCGMDCFGPFVTKQGRKEYKRYGLLFTCMCSRAVHIEMLEDLSTDSFLVGLRCFVALRGTVMQIRSDQGSNFVGASHELAAALNELDISRITTFLTGKQCDFIFNAPHSSHAGGVWERQIRTTRSVLNSTIALCGTRLDDASLRCLFYEAMLIINSRPLTAVDSDPNVETITPNHLITMKSTAPLPPPGKFVKEDMYARKRWRRVQYLMEQFWSRWRKEYLQNLSERQKWNKPRRNVQVGDIVMLTDTEVPRMHWPLATVIEATKDDDGLVRRIKARMSSSSLDKNGRPGKQASVLERPIQKVVVLLEAK